jgi:hypothetical protein
LPPVLQVDSYFFLIFSYLVFSALTDLRYRRVYLELSLPAMALLVLRWLGMLPLLLVAVPVSILLLHYVPRLKKRELIEDVLVFFCLVAVASLSSEEVIALLLPLFFVVDELLLRKFKPEVEGIVYSLFLMSSSFIASGVISWLLMGFGVSVLYSSRGMIGYEDVAHTIVLSLFASSYFGRFSFFAILWIYECLVVPLAILLHLLGIRRSDLARYGRIMAEIRAARREMLVYALASALFALSIFLGKNLVMEFIAVLLLLSFVPRVHYGEEIALPRATLLLVSLLLWICISLVTGVTIL